MVLDTFTGEVGDAIVRYFAEKGGEFVINHVWGDYARGELFAQVTHKGVTYSLDIRVWLTAKGVKDETDR